MKAKILLSALLLIFSNLASDATTFYATRDGDFNETLWSTVSKKGVPGTIVPSQTDIIYIDFEINLNVDLVIHSTGKLVINSGGALTSLTNSLEIKNGGALEVYGILQIYNFTLDNSSNIVIASGVTVTVYNDFTNKNNTDGVVFDGFLDVQGDYYNGNKSVIGGCGKISIAGYYYNWGTAFNTSGQEGYGPLDINCSAVLPISLVDYKINCTNKGVEIAWSTASEINNDYFTIEKSTDLKSWNTAYVLPGSNNSNTIRNYSYNDSHIDGKTQYYKLKQTDFDGKYVYYDILQANCKIINNRLDIIGLNKSNNDINLKISTDDSSPITISIIDINGFANSIEKVIPEKGENSLKIESPKQSGVYLVNLTQNNQRSSKRIYIN